MRARQFMDKCVQPETSADTQPAKALWVVKQSGRATVARANL